MIFNARRVLFLLLILLFALPPSAGKVRADYSISVKGNSVTVTIATVFEQNMTIAPPAYSLTLLGTNASGAAALFSSALNSSAPSVKVTGLRVGSSSTGNVTRTTINFDVEGAATSTRDSTRTNLAWKSFKVKEDIVARGVSLNTVGRYLVASSMLNQVTSSVMQWSYFIDGVSIPYAESAEAAASFQILDFSRLSSPLDSWLRTFSIESGGTTTFSNVEEHNMTIRQNVIVGGSVARTLFFFAGFSDNIQIQVSGLARVIGDTILSDAGSFAPVVMVALTTAFPLAGIAAFLVERRISPVPRKKAVQKPRR